MLAIFLLDDCGDINHVRRNCFRNVTIYVSNYIETDHYSDIMLIQMLCLINKFWFNSWSLIMHSINYSIMYEDYTTREWKEGNDALYRGQAASIAILLPSYNLLSSSQVRGAACS